LQFHGPWELPAGEGSKKPVVNSVLMGEKKGGGEQTLPIKKKKSTKESALSSQPGKGPRISAGGGKVLLSNRPQGPGSLSTKMESSLTDRGGGGKTGPSTRYRKETIERRRSTYSWRGKERGDLTLREEKKDSK